MRRVASVPGPVLGGAACSLASTRGEDCCVQAAACPAAARPQGSAALPRRVRLLPKGHLALLRRPSCPQQSAFLPNRQVQTGPWPQPVRRREHGGAFARQRTGSPAQDPARWPRPGPGRPRFGRLSGLGGHSPALLFLLSSCLAAPTSPRPRQGLCNKLAVFPTEKWR